ncbi:hypothetical protein EKO27_g2167 [Xylaria grammica]|uniref:Uncharacterized protein n=1 Tax=Xylaria grammica TaxID=363999 RepID=A0A439DEY4_9PEZI|nr:hypothetical protein EKO27_g2167 [Xylaria grammica]
MSNPRAPQKPCLRFKRGKCTYGLQCKFSHDLTSPTGHQQVGPSITTSQRPSSNGRKEDDLREWKRLLRQGRRSPSRATSDRFFELALKLVDSDVGACQETVKLLSEEDGLNYIRLLAEKHLPSALDDHAKQDVWAKQMQPLFSLITNQRVVDSAVLEQQVAVIYNYMQGVSSRRMKIIFNFAISLARSAPATSEFTTASLTTSNLDIVEISLAVLSKMIDCNTNNIIDPTFKAVAQEVASILKSSETTMDDFLILQSQRWLSYIECRLGIGDELPSSRAPTTHSAGSRAEFTLPKHLPGRLAASGPRHDNDRDKIADISILPTHGEVMSTRGEYLPTNDPSSFHLPGIMGRLDREFRLLREDTVGQLRDAVRDLLEMLRSRGPGQRTQRRERQSLFTYIYENVEPVAAAFERVNGLDLLVRFPQPKSTTRHKRREWWTQSKRLQPGALVCVIDGDGSVLFCVVAETTTIMGDEKGKGNHRTNTAEESPNRESLSLAEEDEFAYVHLNLAEFKDNSLQQALCWYQNLGPQHQRCLVEFPGVLLASFQHTLEALQMMSKAPNVPFIDLIAPVTPTVGIAEVPPPQYATKPDFYFDLQCLAKDATKLRCSPTQRLDPKILTRHSTLDETQSSALLDSLSRSFALIQGPPGTGKSYTGEKIIKVLLANKKKGNIGPILCVCYTNHALDQLLEHLLDDGVKQIIRIGSRSKSERLEGVNLRTVARTADRTKPEKSSLWETKTALDAQERSVSVSLRELENCLGRPALQAYLLEHHPQHHQALFGTLVDEDGFQEVRRSPHQLLDQWLHSGQASKTTPAPRPIEQLQAIGLWAMSRAERHHLYNYWQRDIRDPIIEDILHGHKEYVGTRSQRTRVIREVDLRCLEAADVVGVTTTGLARNLELLRRLRCKVLICEEAGEVLEAHNLTALLPSIEHCILIGDHLQLRPQIQNYDLNSANPRGAQYSLDVSLFERLVKPSQNDSQRLPFSTLDTQRRMHPSISELIRHTLYPSLVDGANVFTYPEVLGMKKRLFWFHHSVPEDRAQQQDPTSTSHTNSFEVDMTVALVQHLVRQGTYGPDDIAVITPYLGQLHRLRREMQSSLQISVGDKDLEELSALDASKVGEQEESPAHAPNAPVRTTLLKSIRLATVDNFQGEEAKVVVISLVRSNNEKRCGFLNTSNRINVLLSRAKHGMYLISNSDTYEHIPIALATLITLSRFQRLTTFYSFLPREVAFGNALTFAANLKLVAMPARQSTMRFVDSGAIGLTPLVAIPATRPATVNRSARHALAPAKCAAVIQSVAKSAMSLVRPVPSKTVHPPVRIGNVQCLVRHLVTGFPARNDSTMVDFIMGTQYHEVDLDEDPCIFPDCGHFITKTNMDGIMDLKAHYVMSVDEDSSPVALSRGSVPFSMNEVKTCPSCRGSLRNIARYGRIVRRATLDEATKKFISWSHGEFLELAGKLVNVQVGITKAEIPVAQLLQHQKTPPSTLVMSKGRLQQLQRVVDWVGNSRYKDAIRLWNQISAFIGKVRKEEQPLQRVADHVRHATRQRKITGAFSFDESTLQVKGVLQASALLLKCEIVILTDFMMIRQPLIPLRPEIHLDLTKQMNDCETLISMAESAHYPREETEGHIYLAQFCAFARTLTPEPSGDSTPAETSSETRDKLKDRGTAHIAAARQLIADNQSVLVLQHEIEAAEKMLRDAIFYTEVSAEEMRAVYQAMAREFSGTGHWYNCVNGHPFTIGECGMPMEQARCPECGASVGGQNHSAVEGVRRAHDIEALARDVNRMGI